MRRKMVQQKTTSNDKNTNPLSAKAVLVSLNISRWTARAYDMQVTRKVHEVHGASQDSGRYRKRLLEKGALKDMTGIISEARDYHYTHTQPWLDSGQRILPTALFVEYTQKIAEFRKRFEAQAATFIKAYPLLKARAKAKLGQMYSELDYPSEKEIARKFAFDTVIIACPNTDDFRVNIPKEMLADVQRDLEARLTTVMQGTVTDACERIITVVGHMAERLKAFKPGDVGERAEGTFRDSMVENVRELATLLPAFNITGSNQLAVVTGKIQDLLCKHDADDLRSDAKLRANVAAAAAQIVNDVSAFI